MTDIPHELVAYAVLGSLIPTTLWIMFWSKRDRFCPEPKLHIFGAFVFGALAALFTLPGQSLVVAVIGDTGTVALVLFVVIEEIAKLVACWYIAMRANVYFNERIDPIIYLTTTALGFAALENILYFLQYLNQFAIDMAILEGGKRIVGAGILHMVTCGIIGVCIAIAWKSSAPVRILMGTIGLILAIAIHVGFNHMVMFIDANITLYAFGGTWFLFIVILICLEILRSPTCPPEINWEQHV